MSNKSGHEQYERQVSAWVIKKYLPLTMLVWYIYVNLAFPIMFEENLRHAKELDSMLEHLYQKK